LSCWNLIASAVDVIHMQDGLLSPMGVILKKLFRKPLCVVIHGLDVTYKNKLYQMVVKWSLKRTDKIICISDAAQTEVIKRGIDSSKTIVIPLGINDDVYSGNHSRARKYLESKLNLSEDSKIILSVGRLVERKGAHWFIANVMPEIVKKNNKIVFLISGDGESRELVKAAIEKNNMAEHVYLLGRTSDEMRLNLYNGADLFVMPNIPVDGDMEGFGLVLLEASLCELPIVAAGIEGIKDAITDGKNGVLVPTQNAGAHINAVTKFLNDPAYSKRFGKNSRDFTKQHYNWQTIAKRFTAVYSQLTGAK
jgi:glycosyltransferase involved in cell wall biosynthesis